MTLKLGLTVLFIDLKIILLQYFQFSAINDIQVIRSILFFFVGELYTCTSGWLWIFFLILILILILHFFIYAFFVIGNIMNMYKCIYVCRLKLLDTCYCSVKL